MTATGSFNVKSLFKNNYEKTSSRIATFCEAFNYFYDFIKHMHIPNDVKK